MLFNSIQFLAFFPTVAILHYLSPHSFRRFILLAASCIFYMAFIPYYILVLAATILVDYLAALYIDGKAPKFRNAVLAVSIATTCLILFVFKYFNFFVDNIIGLAEFLHWNYSLEALEIVLPLGLSFHTFQSLSYVIEVYRRKQRAERNFLTYALYVMFFPQLVAGPIERPQNMLHQFHEKKSFNICNVYDGLSLMAWGFFKKLVVADRAALLVNQIYNNIEGYSGGYLAIATVFFAFQIYCDFSGYSDIARGSAQVLGFKLMVNFDKPYFSKSISEFWRRWHISLSTWFRDYLYIPLGGNRASRARWQMNLFLTFLVSGLWHGANWTYVLWGALNGSYLLAAIWTGDLRTKVWSWTQLDRFPVFMNAIKIAVTFCLVSFSWIFFRAGSMHDVKYILANMFGKSSAVTPFDSYELALCAFFICILVAIEMYEAGKTWLRRVLEGSILFRWGFDYALILVILAFGVYDNPGKFIYFQF